MKKQSSLTIVINLLVAWCLVCLLVASVTAGVQFNNDYQQWQTQNVCVAQLVSQGVERKHINRLGDGCSITIGYK
jgi:hypothetical protein